MRRKIPKISPLVHHVIRQCFTFCTYHRIHTKHRGMDYLPPRILPGGALRLPRWRRSVVRRSPGGVTFTGTVQSAPVVCSSPVRSSSLNSSQLHSTPLHSSAFHSTLHSTPLVSTHFHPAPLHVIRSFVMFTTITSCRFTTVIHTSPHDHVELWMTWVTPGAILRGVRKEDVCPQLEVFARARQGHVGQGTFPSLHFSAAT